MYSLCATENIMNWLNKELKTYLVDMSFSKNKYITHEYNHKNFNIKIYTTKLIFISGEYKERIYEKLIDISEENNCLGCDEVGVGDFFGPVVYCSVFFDEQTIKILKKKHLPIKDSKKLKDEEIKKIYESLKNDVNFAVEIMYDYQIQEMNSVEQKVYNHHKNCEKYFKVSPQKIVIDLFTTINAFNKYSKKLKINWENNLILETKADSKYLSVALASIFARAIFLEEMQKLEKKYNMKFPLGAGNVKKVGKEFIIKYSKEELATFAKTSFKTFNEL